MNLSAASVEFLMENAMRDDREWFHENKDRFRALVIEPLQELVTRLAPGMLELDSQLVVEPRISRTISRVYRDTRYSRDKSLYRSNMWIVFGRDKRLYPEAPAFFFEFSAQIIYVGCGYYCAPPDVLREMKRMVLEDDPFWTPVRELLRTGRFMVDGDLYKRSKYPAQPPEKRNLLDRKNICFLRESQDYDLIFSDRLSEALMDDFRALLPTYEFFLRALESSRREA